VQVWQGGEMRNNPQINKWVAETTALVRAGLFDDVSGVVAYLYTDDAKWINGQRLEVSGGINWWVFMTGSQ